MRVVMSLLLSVAVAALVLLTALRSAEPTALAAGSAGASMAVAYDTDDDDGDIINGRRLFLRENCYGCHGGRGGGGMCPSLRNGIDEDDAEDAIEEGTPNGMPAYEDRLDDDEIEDLIAYLKSLRSPREPVFTHWWERRPTQ
jgi:cytochrome c551